MTCQPERPRKLLICDTSVGTRHGTRQKAKSAVSTPRGWTITSALPAAAKQSISLCTYSENGRRGARPVLRRGQGPPSEARSQDGIVPQGPRPAAQPVPQLRRGGRRREGRCECSIVLFCLAIGISFIGRSIVCAVFFLRVCCLFIGHAGIS